MISIQRVVPIGEAEREEPEDPRAPFVGRWYWLRDSDDDKEERAVARKGKQLVCVTHIGSNFAQLTGIRGSSWRVHFKDFYKLTTPEPDARAYALGRVEHHRQEATRLLGKVQEVTAKLHVGVRRELGSEAAGSALALSGGREDPKQYGKALAKAKEKTLPELFKQVEEQHELMAAWMKMELVPLKAEAETHEAVVEAIEQRISSVELYAGLVEELHKFADGKPAPEGEKIRLIQRRAYMDEECLINYRHGGMKFEHIEQFDEWLAEPENRDRVLPFPRCAIAMQVRRHTRSSEHMGFDEFIRFWFGGGDKAEKQTYLYIRNGEQLFWLQTAFDFDSKLFPDLENIDALSGVGQLYAKDEHFGKWSVISEGSYRQMRSEDAKVLWEHRAEERAKKKADRHWWKPTPKSKSYEPFNRDNVHFDDITASMHAEQAKHNRLVLILQGLLDRSAAFHPHPPWQLWGEGFAAGIELVYDDSRALVPGEAPDFDAFRRRLNAHAKPGDVFVGQQDAWERHEARKENERRSRSWRYRSHDRELTHYTPDGNEGPGDAAIGRKITREGGVVFHWKRERLRQRWRWSDEDDKQLNSSFTVPLSKLLNVSAYKLGDYKQFFNDPRTREDYLKWAPLLLLAEEVAAGKRKVKP